jgi:hypothetical protein
VVKLSKKHVEILFPTTEPFAVVITILPFYTTLKTVEGGKLQQQHKDHLSLVHPDYFEQRKVKLNSNRCLIKNSANEDISRLSKNF